MSNCSTPAKDTSTLLKTAILQKISSKKKKILDLTTSTKTPIMHSTIQQEETTPSQELILAYQNAESPGFFSYMDWLTFNEQNFKVGKKIVDDLWKTMRIINFGQVMIPSGLIHDVYVELISKENQGGLEPILNDFLKLNDVNDTVKGFKDLKNYTDLKTIECHYKGFVSHDQKRPRSCGEIKKTINSKSKKDVFTRIHEEAKTRTNKKLGLVCSQICRQMSECKFKPEIHKYESSFERGEKPERICHNKEKWKTKEEELEGVERILKAKKIDQSLFQVDMQQIPGVISHINRNKHCEAQRQRIKRLLNRPVLSYSKMKKT